MPRISVLMPVYNCEHYLREAVDSILGQTLADFELIAVNDGSTDSSLAILEEAARRDNRIRLISRGNTGLSRALNEALGVARGEFVARMDADDISLLRRFELQADFLISHPDYVLVGGRTESFDPEGVVAWEGGRLQSHERIDAFHINSHGIAIVHPAAMFRRSAMERVGGYNPEREPAEDLDIFLRVAELGKVENLSELVLRYRLLPSSVFATRNRQIWRQQIATIADARKRRGLEPIASPPEPPVRRPRNLWVRLAYANGSFSAARRMSIKALRDAPWELESWRVLAIGMFGPLTPTLLRVRQSIRNLGRSMRKAPD